MLVYLQVPVTGLVVAQVRVVPTVVAPEPATVVLADVLAITAVGVLTTDLTRSRWIQVRRAEGFTIIIIMSMLGLNIIIIMSMLGLNIIMVRGLGDLVEEPFVWT